MPEGDTGMGARWRTARGNFCSNLRKELVSIFAISLMVLKVLLMLIYPWGLTLVLILPALIICWLPWRFFPSTRPCEFSYIVDETPKTQSEDSEKEDYWESSSSEDDGPSPYNPRRRRRPKRRLLVRKRRIPNKDGYKPDEKKRSNRGSRTIEVYVSRNPLTWWRCCQEHPKPDPDSKEPRRSSGYWQRTWDLFEITNELWRTLHRQGLQVAGVVCGLVILTMQVETIGHDLSSATVVKYYQALTSGLQSASNALEGDKTCGYATGLGVANWGGGLENLVWFAFYHLSLCILCLMLILDELVNVRVGLFAPQWNRAGHGYTIMFLAVATLANSPNWGILPLVRLRYVTLVTIFTTGLYNVVITMFSSCGCLGRRAARSVTRLGRRALRLWTDEEWNNYATRFNFLTQKRFTDKSNLSKGEVEAWNRLHLFEKWQSAIGDHSVELEPIDIVELEQERLLNERTDISAEQRKKFLKLIRDMEDGLTYQRVYRKSRTEAIRQKGQVDRKWIHGVPINTLNFTRRQRNYDRKRGSLWKWKQEYYGIADWIPYLEEGKHYMEKYFFLWFDIRRAFAATCAIGLFGIHVGICVSDLAFSNYAAYNDAYADISASWSSENGPDATKCQYFPDSTVAVWVWPGTSAYRMVTTLMAWQGMWHAFLMGMCVAVFMVSWSNNRAYGMHIPFPPITLIGPRLSSNSIGWTLGFVAWATLALGFFPNQPDGKVLTRAVCYASLVCWGTYLIPNEAMRNVYQRNPFWRAMSEAAARYMDNKKIRHGIAEFDDD